jgi:hypothetical protein
MSCYSPWCTHLHTHTHTCTRTHTHTGSSCVSCKAGFYKALPGAAACEGCPAGKFVGSIAAVKCQDCLAHSASTEGSASCYCVAVCVCVCARARASERASERAFAREQTRLHSIQVPKQQYVSVHAYSRTGLHRRRILVHSMRQGPLQGSSGIRSLCQLRRWDLPRPDSLHRLQALRCQLAIFRRELRLLVQCWIHRT